MQRLTGSAARAHVEAQPDPHISEPAPGGPPPTGSRAGAARLTAAKLAGRGRRRRRDGASLDQANVGSPAGTGVWLGHAQRLETRSTTDGDHAMVAEAMTNGRAVVVSPVGRQRDLVVSDVTGLHDSTLRAQARALTFRHLLAEPFDLEGVGLAGADRARSRDAWPRVAHESVSVYARDTGPAATAQEDDEVVPTDTEAQTAPVASPSRTAR